MIWTTGSEGEGWVLDPWIWERMVGAWTPGSEGGGLVSEHLGLTDLTSKGDLVASSSQCAAA